MGLQVTAARVLVGHCPECGAVVVVTNDGEVWPLVECPKCPGQWATDELVNRVRLEAGWRAEIDGVTERLAPTDRWGARLGLVRRGRS